MGAKCDLCGICESEVQLRNDSSGDRKWRRQIGILRIWAILMRGYHAQGLKFAVIEALARTKTLSLTIYQTPPHFPTKYGKGLWEEKNAMHRVCRWERTSKRRRASLVELLPWVLRKSQSYNMVRIWRYSILHVYWLVFKIDLSIHISIESCGRDRFRLP